MGSDTPIERPVIFFDGFCNLCNASVNFIIKRDKNAYFRFSSLQGSYASEALPKEYIDTDNLPSLILMDKKVRIKSTAALTIAKNLRGLWPLLYVFMIIPAFLRHFIYDLVAKNRYKWFGKKEECMIPTPELKDRFID